MFNRSPLSRIIPIAALAALMLAGCNESATDTREDVAEARQDARENVSEARQDANQTMRNAEDNVREAQDNYSRSDIPARAEVNDAQSDAMSDRAEANYDVAIAEAEGIEKVESEKCGILSGAEKRACLSAAASNFEASKARATAERDAALVAATTRQ